MKVIAIKQALLKFNNVYIYLQSYYLVFLKIPYQQNCQQFSLSPSGHTFQEESVDFIG